MLYNSSIIDTLYSIQAVVALLIILLLIIISFSTDKYTRVLASIILASMAILHYYTLSIISSVEKVLVYPLLVVEEKNGYSSTTIDIGQISIITLIWVWRKDIVNYVSKLVSLARNKIKTCINMVLKRKQKSLMENY